MTTIHQIKTVLFSLALLAPVAHAAQIEHLEPAFWWAGMKEPKLQLMVHARDIQQAQVELNYPGVKLTGLQKVQNPNYLFVDLELSPDVKPGSFELVFTDRGKVLARHNYNLLARQPGSAQRQGFRRRC